MNGYRKRQLVALLVTILGVAVFFALVGSAGANPVIDSKRAAAKQAWDEINQMDIQVEKIVARYDGAMYHYQQTSAALKRTRNELGIARKSLGYARHALARRVISVYMEQGSSNDSTIAILFQATSIQDMINRMESAQRVSDHDAQVVKQVKNLSDQVAARAVSLAKMQTREKALLNEISAEKSSIQSKIADRTAYLHKVRHEIASLQAEAQRQARLAAQQARITVQRATGVIPVDHGPVHIVPGSPVGSQAVQYAMSKLGDPYVWGAAGPDEFDCSGLVVWAYQQAGVNLPHYTFDLEHSGPEVTYDQLQPGDLVFFYGGAHVGIYVGGGQFIHAPHTGTVVQVSTLAGYGGGMTYAVRIGV